MDGVAFFKDETMKEVIEKDVENPCAIRKQAVLSGIGDMGMHCGRRQLPFKR